MLIDETKLKHWIDYFYGYGSWQARFWFIGYEEGGGELPEEVADKINYFHAAHPTAEGAVCDIRKLYGQVAMNSEGPKGRLFSNRFEYRFGTSAIQSNVWKNLIAFEHGYGNEKLPDLLTYQREKFLAPPSAREALIQLYPLPSPHNHAWYYSWLDMPQLRFIKDRTIYQEQVYPGRIHTILTQLRTHRPELVLMHGMSNINMLKKSVQEFFPEASFTSVKATKLVIPQYHRADFGGTTLLMTTQIPALRHNRIETGFDWEELGKRVRSGT